MSRDTGSLTDFIGRFAGLNVWVVGDMMLDEYVVGDVGRISPEGPIPVVRVRETQHRLGGAANVARQITVLGARAQIVGLAGNDGAGEQFVTECHRANIDTSCLLRVDDLPTTRKLRVLSRRQQMLRLDWEDARPCSAQLQRRILRQLHDAGSPDVVILSDYAKGLLTDELIAEVIALAKQRGAPVVVDPKRPKFDAYSGAAVITPNLAELEAALGESLDPADEDSIGTAAAGLLAKVGGVDALVVTRSEYGMLVVPRSGDRVSIPAERHEVFDVTGAGDTAIAVLGLSLAAGAALQDAARLANAAAGLAVTQVGAAAVSADSIRESLTRRRAGKVLTRDELATRVRDWRLSGKQVVFTNGCFDLLHAGHLSLLHEAAALGDVLVLAINSDESVRRLKGPERPLVGAQERAALLAALECVDAVTIFDEDTPLQTLQAAPPDVLVKGQDYTKSQVVGREVVEANGGRVELVPLLPNKSTTALLERIKRSQR